MKRGKRQVVQQPIVFDAEDPAPPNEQLLSHFSISHSKSHTTNHSPIIHHQHIEHKQEQKREQLDKNMSRVSQQPVVQKSTPMKVQENGNEDQKKKRLQLLRQKYLKKKQQNQPQISRQPPVELIKKQSEKQKEEIEIVKETEKTQLKKQNIIKNVQKNKIEEADSFFDSFAKHSSQSNQKQDHSGFTPSRPNNNYMQNQMPISKPTQSISNHNQTKLTVAPPAPESKRNKKPPPKPVMPVIVKSTVEPTTPQFNTSFEHENSEQNQKQIKSQIQEMNQKISQFNHSKLEPSKIPGKKQVPPPGTKKSVGSPKKKPIVADENKQKQSNLLSSQSLNKAIENWLSSNCSNIKDSEASEDTISLLANQISQKGGDLACNIVKKFMIFNSSLYTEDQSNFVFDALTKNRNISELTRLYFTIKCGGQALNKFQNETSPQTLEQLIKLKSCLLEIEQDNYINFFLQRNSGHHIEQLLTKLFQFSPSSTYIQEYISSYHFQNPLNITQLLTSIKRCIASNEALCPLYFKLVNLIVQHISDEVILQSILKLVNNVSYKSAYQMKKDIKLKIIEKIDRASQKTSTQNTKIERQQYREPIQQNRSDKDRENEKDKDKGLVVGNLMGYVNQAFKIITSQIPQKISNPPPSTVQQPQQSITWDPVLGRYLINGKVPENQAGSVFDSSTNVEKEGKKKPPPPPPRAIKPKQPSKLQTNQKKQHIESIQETRGGQDYKQSQQGKQIEQFQNKQQNQEKNPKNKVPPPPGRMGIKGLGIKKPKVTARYA